MSRHGYQDADDFDDDSYDEDGEIIEGSPIWEWQNLVDEEIGSERGQRLLLDLRDAMDAMTEKTLIAGDLVNDDGQHCALGVVGAARGLPLAEIDPEDAQQVAKEFDIAECLARHIVYENDEFICWPQDGSEDEKRWRYMRNWCERHIKQTPEPAAK